MCIFESVPPSVLEKKGKRAKMRKLTESEVGLRCLKSRKTSHGNKEVCLKGICQKVVVSAVIWVRNANKNTEEESQREV